MLKVLLFQLDGKIPNIALMRIAAHHKRLGNEVEFRWTKNPQRDLWDKPDLVYASSIFEKTKPVLVSLLNEFPNAIVGGTGIDVKRTLESVGIDSLEQDYSIYPKWQQSIGFTQRGCRLKCPFCVVPRKEGKMREERTILDIWRGYPHPKELLLLDNDFFGQEHWRERISEIREGGFKVSLTQGINVRLITEESAEAIASIQYRDDSMKHKRVYTAWDNLKDEDRLFSGLNLLVKAGIRPRDIMVYMLIGYWPFESENDRLYREKKLREFGCMPYPMPYIRTKELVGFQRWVITGFNRYVSWEQWKKDGYYRKTEPTSEYA